MDKKKLLALLIFLIMGFFMVSFANPSETLRPVSNDNTKETETSNNANSTTRRRRNNSSNVNNNQTNNSEVIAIEDDNNNEEENGIGNVDKDLYIVRFMDYQKNVLKSQNVYEGDDASDSDVTVDDYTSLNITYTFKNWDKEFTNVTKNLDVNALYDIDKIMATIYINGEKTDETIEVKINDDTKNKKDVDLTDDNIDDYFNKDDLPNPGDGKEDEIEKLVYDEEEGYIIEVKEDYINYNIYAYDGALVNGKEKITAHINDVITLSHKDKSGYEFKYYTIIENDNVIITTDEEITVHTNDIYVYANYEVITYNISYILNGGEVKENPTSYTVETNDITLNNPTKVGYTFVGWTIDNERANKEVVIKKGSTGNRVYTAHYEARNDIKYVIETYEENLEYASEEDKYSKVKEKELFDGTADEEKEIKAEAIKGFVTPESQVVTIAADGSTIVKFYYDREEHSVTFNVNDEEYSKSTLKYGAQITIPEYEVAAGYTFSGWTNVEATMGTKDLEYNATYSANEDTKYIVITKEENLDGTYTITSETRQGTTDEEITVNAPAAKTGFELVSDRAKTITITAEPTQEVEFVYNRVINTVTFNVNDEEYSKSKLKYGAQITIPEYEVAAGYTFSGWTNVEATMGTKDLEYNATYSANKDTKYTVIINEENLDGTYTTTSQTREGTTDKTVIVTVDDKTGFSVDAKEKEVTIKGDGSATVEFTYTREEHSVTFNVNDEEYSKSTLKYGAQITIPEYEVAAGYTFSGWTNVEATMGTKDLVYNATYSANKDTKYTIEKYLENLEYTSEDDKYTKVTPDITGKYTTDEELTINAPEVDGFTPTVASITKKIAGDGSTVYAFYYNRNVLAVTFVYHEGIEIKTTKYEGSVTAPTIENTYNENGYDYTFAQWDKAFDKVVENITVNAKYSKEVTTYTIDYVLDGGIVKKQNPTTYTVEELPLTINSPVKVGYNFINWTDENNNEVVNTILEGTTGNKILTAHYEARNDIKYTVKVLEEKLDGEYKEVSSKEYSDGTADQVKEITAPNANDGFTLVGDATRNVTIAADGSTVVEFKYSRNTYTATFTINNDVYEIKSFKYGQTITKPSYTVATGYTFSGWTTDATMPASDKTYNATLEIKKFTVKWEIDGKVVETDENVEYNSIATYDGETPAKDGYTYLGWKDANGNDETTSITADTTFKAQLVTLTAKIKANHQLSYTKSYDGNKPELVKDDITVTLVNLGGEDKVLNKDEYTTDFDNTAFVKSKTLNITYTKEDLTLTNNKLKYSVIYLAYQSKFEVDVSIKNTYTYTKNSECMGTNGTRCDEGKNVSTKTLKNNFLEVTEHYNQFVTVQGVTVKYSDGSTATLNLSDRVRWSYVETIADLSNKYVRSEAKTIQEYAAYPANAYTRETYWGSVYYEKASGTCNPTWGRTCTYYTFEAAIEYNSNTTYYTLNSDAEFVESRVEVNYGYHDPVYIATKNNADVMDANHEIDTVTVRYHRDANEEDGESEGYFDVIFKYDPEVEGGFYCIDEVEVN